MATCKHKHLVQRLEANDLIGATGELNNGANPNYVSDSVSAMHLAAGFGLEPLCLLLQYGGDPNVRADDGTTPLHVAAIWGFSDCLQILLANGGDPYIRDQDGMSALDLAQTYRNDDAIQALQHYMYLLKQEEDLTLTPKFTYKRLSCESGISGRSSSQGHSSASPADLSRDSIGRDSNLSMCRDENYSVGRDGSLSIDRDGNHSIDRDGSHSIDRDGSLSMGRDGSLSMGRDGNHSIDNCSLYSSHRRDLRHILNDFTKKRRSSVYIRNLQQQVDQYFADGQKTHIVDVTSPDHPYIEPRPMCNHIIHDAPATSDWDPDTSEESLQLHLSLSATEDQSTSFDSFVTCDGEDLDTVLEKPEVTSPTARDNDYAVHYNDYDDYSSHCMPTVVKNHKFAASTNTKRQAKQLYSEPKQSYTEPTRPQDKSTPSPSTSKNRQAKQPYTETTRPQDKSTPSPSTSKNRQAKQLYTETTRHLDKSTPSSSTSKNRQAKQLYTEPKQLYSEPKQLYSEPTRHRDKSIPSPHRKKNSCIDKKNTNTTRNSVPDNKSVNIQCKNENQNMSGCNSVDSSVDLPTTPTSKPKFGNNFRSSASPATHRASDERRRNKYCRRESQTSIQPRSLQSDVTSNTKLANSAKCVYCGGNGEHRGKEGMVCPVCWKLDHELDELVSASQHTEEKASTQQAVPDILMTLPNHGSPSLPTPVPTSISTLTDKVRNVSLEPSQPWLSLDDKTQPWVSEDNQALCSPRTARKITQPCLSVWDNQAPGSQRNARKFTSEQKTSFDYSQERYLKLKQEMEQLDNNITLDETSSTMKKDMEISCIDLEFAGDNITKTQPRKKQGSYPLDDKENVVPNSESFVNDLWTEVRACSSAKRLAGNNKSNVLDMAFCRRGSIGSLYSDASTVDYVYTDTEHNIQLIERHLPSACGSAGSRRSLDSLFSGQAGGASGDASPDIIQLSDCTLSDHEISQSTQLYNWRDSVPCSSKPKIDKQKQSSASPSNTPPSCRKTKEMQVPVPPTYHKPQSPTTKSKASNNQDMVNVDNSSLRTKLCNIGADPGPVTTSTRQTYITQLNQLQNDPDRKLLTKKTPDYHPELRLALAGNLDLSDMPDLETKMVEAFQNPSRLRRWREGTLKSSFNYILLDPRVTRNLPNRAANMSDLDVLQTFISAIFYIGKGKRARPYCHLYEAIKQQKQPKAKVSQKIQLILDIWASGLGVVSLHCFQSVIPVEAYTREACMVDAMGLNHLTNMKRGDYYGISATYSMKQRRKMGVFLLTKTLQIFLAEGERQISPLDIKNDP